MKVPISWLNEYVDVSDLSVKELSDKLTFSGVEVEGIEEVGAVLDDNFVVGEILTCDAHPNSDHLHICNVSDGTQEFQVVCGAPNAAAGIKVPFAKIGAVVPEGGFKIKQAKLRGVESFGMLCSARELKLSADHSGLMLLDATVKTGTPMRDLLPKPDVVMDLEITWNRPDCLSIIGIAREFAALLKRPLKLPARDFVESADSVNQFAKVVVQDPVKCPRYTARVITSIKDGPSPEWMQRRLELCGVRAISLVVDVTNYVMLEYGQPLHAFDYRKLAENTIVVRCATPGEKMKTLDGIERTLDNTMLVIADAKTPNAVAGIMGGAESEIAIGTECVLLESALFDPASTKWTSTKLGLSSESSRRFERGVDLDLADIASRRAIALLAQYGAAVVAKGSIDVDNRNYTPGEVALRVARVSEVIGVPIAREAINAILTGLGLKLLTPVDADTLRYQIPSWRLDLTLEADLIEEIARMHGLDAIPDRMPISTAVSNLDDSPFYARAKCRELLLGMGFSEAMHYSFLSAQELDMFDTRNAAARAVIPYPVSADYGVLRDSLLPQLVGSLGRNASRQIEKAGLFEIGRVFAVDANKQPSEEERIAVGLMGPLGRSAIDSRRPVTSEEALLWIKGVIENLVAARHAGKLDFVPVQHPAMEAGYALEIKLNNQVAGLAGIISGTIRHQWRMTTAMAVAEIKVAPLLAATRKGGSIKPAPQYPAAQRDVAFVAEASLTHADVLAAIRKVAPAELTTITLFDIFQSKEMSKQNKRSMAYTLEFRSADRTLTDDFVNGAFTKILQALKNELKVDIREG